jgi:hypothetical protein
MKNAAQNNFRTTNASMTTDEAKQNLAITLNIDYCKHPKTVFTDQRSVTKEVSIPISNGEVADADLASVYAQFTSTMESAAGPLESLELASISVLNAVAGTSKITLTAQVGIMLPTYPINEQLWFVLETYSWYKKGAWNPTYTVTRPWHTLYSLGTRLQYKLNNRITNPLSVPPAGYTWVSIVNVSTDVQSYQSSVNNSQVPGNNLYNGLVKFTISSRAPYLTPLSASYPCSFTPNEGNSYLSNHEQCLNHYLPSGQQKIGCRIFEEETLIPGGNNLYTENFRMHFGNWVLVSGDPGGN